MPHLLAAANPAPLGALDVAGAALWLVGFAGEATADWQLARFKGRPVDARARVQRRPLGLVAPSQLLLRVAGLAGFAVLALGRPVGVGTAFAAPAASRPPAPCV